MSIAFGRRIGAALAALLLLAVPASAQTTAPDGPTLAAVRARGHLICAGSDPLPGFAQVSAQGLWTGFDVDICRAVATAWEIRSGVEGCVDSTSGLSEALTWPTSEARHAVERPSEVKKREAP